MKTLFVLIVVLFASLSPASFKKGNGGNVIYCENETLQWQVLDSYETEQVLLLNKDKNLFTADFNESFLARLKDISPRLAEIYLEQSKRLNDQTRWVSGVDLGPVNDSFHLILPRGCTLKQAAIQTARVYIFDADIYDQLSEMEKSILTSHELLYRSLMQYSMLEDSRPVRALIGLLISEEFTKMKSDERQFFLKTHQIALP